MAELVARSVAENYAEVLGSLEKANAEHGRNAKLLAVSKTFGVEDMMQAYAAGARSFGENYVQEACTKFDWFRENHPECSIEWHLIGPLQANKTKPVAERFDWVQSIDRLRIAKRLNDQRPEGMAPINVLIEVNIDGEETKSGITPEELPELAAAVNELPNLRLRGLMFIPQPTENGDMSGAFGKARALFDKYREEYGFDTLSMGMSADMAQAVEYGSAMVRVGTAIFGRRFYPAKK